MRFRFGFRGGARIGQSGLVRSVEGYSFESCCCSVVARVSRRISRRISGGFERFSRRFLPDCLGFPSEEGTYDGHRVKVQSVRPSKVIVILSGIAIMHSRDPSSQSTDLSRTCLVYSRPRRNGAVYAIRNDE